MLRSLKNITYLTSCVYDPWWFEAVLQRIWGYSRPCLDSVLISQSRNLLLIRSQLDIFSRLDSLD